MPSTSTNILQNNSASLNDLYKELQGAHTISEQTSMEQTISAINLNLAQLGSIQEQLSTYNNINQETLLKQQQLLKMENDSLMNQLRELENIQNIVINKDRIIDQTNQNIIDSDYNIKILVICLVLGIILLVCVYLKGYGILKSNSAFYGIFVIYIIVFIYVFNIFYVKTAISYLSDRKARRLNNVLQKWSAISTANEQENKYGSKSAWEADNCSCPTAETQEEYITDNNSGNTIQSPRSGHYYYDGTAPQQLLVPLPSLNNSTNFREKIDWVDYSNNGTIPYKNNYYNSGSTTDPVNTLINDLQSEEYSSLVGVSTYTNSL